jgi:hypothetical protein
VLQEAVGEEGAFMQRFGYHADILRPTFTDSLPEGWESRLNSVPDHDNVFTLDPYDLALVKLTIGRLKDLDLVRAMLRLGIVEPERLRAHYQQVLLGENEAATAGRNLTLLLREIQAD